MEKMSESYTSAQGEQTTIEAFTGNKIMGLEKFTQDNLSNESAEACGTTRENTIQVDLQGRKLVDGDSGVEPQLMITQYEE